MTPVTIYVAARCEKAGRKTNQDSILVCPDLSLPQVAMTSSFELDKSVTLDRRGALLLIADGMGGMNAGERASQLVVEGVRQAFADIPDDAVASPAAAGDFVAKAVAAADAKVKQWAATNSDAQGMGSTVALVWLLGDKVIVGWCGDSRVYRFNPDNGLVRLSHDHSYVQSLVDSGKIPADEAFDHPDSNVITRSLGDNGMDPEPQVEIYDVYTNDVFLICSDGLCGLIPDAEIERIMLANSRSTGKCLDALWHAGDVAGFTDNCSVVLARVADGGRKALPVVDGYVCPVKAPVDVVAPRRGAAPGRSMEAARGGVMRRVLLICAVALAVIAIAAVGYFVGVRSADGDDNDEMRGRDGGTFNYERVSDDDMPRPVEDVRSEHVRTPGHSSRDRHDSRAAEPVKNDKANKDAKDESQTPKVKATKVDGAPVPSTGNADKNTGENKVKSVIESSSNNKKRTQSQKEEASKKEVKQQKDSKKTEDPKKIKKE